MIGLSAVRARAKESLLARRFIGGAAWSLVGAIGSSGITLIMFMIVARLLGRENYGQFVIIQSTLGMAGIFAGFGLGTAAIRYAAELRVIDPTRLAHILTLGERSIVSLGLVASASLAISADWLASRVLNSPALADPLFIAAFVVAFSAVDSYQKSVLIGLESMRALAAGSIASLGVGFPVVLIATSSLGLRGAAIGIVVLAAIQAAISRYQMTRAMRSIGVLRNASGCLRERAILWRFALPALISGALVGPVHWAAQAILANTPSGYTELAVLGVAMQWFNLILFIPGSVGRVVLPILTDYVTKGDSEHSQNILHYAMLGNAVVTIPAALLICLLSQYVLALYGDEYGNDRVSLILAVLTASLVAVLAPVGSLLAAKSRMWLGSSMNVGWAIVYLFLTVVFVNNGAIGVLSALAIAYIAHSVWVGYFAMNQLAKP